MCLIGKLFVCTLVSGDRDAVVPLGSTLPIYDKLPEDKRCMHIFHDVGHFPNGQIPAELTDLFVLFAGRL